MQTQTITDPIHNLIEILRYGIDIGELKEDMDTFDTKCKELKGNKLEEYLQEVFDRV